MLYIIATPIGNREDITLRAIKQLKEVDFILAEDTRKSGFFLSHLGIKKKLISFYDHNEERKIPQTIEQLKQGKNIALISNAGVPTISDPGYKLVRACREEGIEITSLPGPSSITTALSLTSIPHERFVFLGYAPRKANQRRKLFEHMGAWGITLVFFESPFRIKATLKAVQEMFSERKVAVIREMTKKYEEAVEGTAEEVCSYFEGKTSKGEFVLIISGK